MPIERGSVYTNADLVIAAEPGVIVVNRPLVGFSITVSGYAGARFLGKLIEEATALRKELEAAL